MTLTQYLRVLREQWLVVALLALLSLGGAAAYTYRQVPVYSAQIQLFVSVRSTDTDTSQLSQGSTFTQQRVKSYADLVSSPVIAKAVIDQLGLTYTPEQLGSQITATSPLDTVLLDISVSDTDPGRAQAIANAVGYQFPRLIAALETPTGQVMSPVKVSITREAVRPAVPISPRIPLNLALGLIVGLGLGIGAAVLRDQFNTTVGQVNELEKLTGAIPLGVVPYDASASKQPLVTADQFGGRAEAFRTLRTNLQFADVDDPPRVITISSPLPAEGKTTTACNIALTLAQSGARVILVEGDLRKPSVGTYLGISNAAGLTNVLAGQHELRDVIVSYQRDTLAVLPSGPTPPNPSELLGSQQMRHLLTSLANHYDLVIIDAPPLLPVTDAAVLAAAADGAILVVRHGKTRREEVERALQALTSVNAKVLGTVLNFAPRRTRRGGYDGYGYGYGYGSAAVAAAGTGTPDGALPKAEKARRARKAATEQAPPSRAARRSRDRGRANPNPWATPGPGTAALPAGAPASVTLPPASVTLPLASVTLPPETILPPETTLPPVTTLPPIGRPHSAPPTAASPTAASPTAASPPSTSLPPFTLPAAGSPPPARRLNGQGPPAGRGRPNGSRVRPETEPGAGPVVLDLSAPSAEHLIPPQGGAHQNGVEQNGTRPPSGAEQDGDTPNGGPPNGAHPGGTGVPRHHRSKRSL